MIAVAEKGKKNKELFIIENIDKTAIAKFAKVLSTINLSNKYNWAINNTDINITRNLRLTSIKKY